MPKTSTISTSWPVNKLDDRVARKHSRSKHYYNERVANENEAINHCRVEPFVGNHQSSRSPAARRVYTSMIRAPQWHGAQTHFPPRPRKSAWHCDITNVISPHGLPTHYGSKHITWYHQSSRSPATRRVYASMFRAPQWHGATQTHFPPRPRKSAWHSDITDVISPHRLSQTKSKHFWVQLRNAVSHGATHALSYYKSAWPLLTSGANFANALSHTTSPLLSQPRKHLYYKLATSESSSEKLFPALHLYCKLATSESSSEKLFPALHLYYKLATSESSSDKLFPVLHLYYKLATSESSSEKRFPALHLFYKLATSESSSEKLFPALHLFYKLATSESNSEVHKVLRLPRNLHFEVHEVLCLRASPSAVPATKSAHRGSQSGAPATKSALRASPSAVPATKSAHRGSQSGAPATKIAHWGSQSAAPATRSALQETNANSNNGGTIRAWSEHDARPCRNRRSAELAQHFVRPLSLERAWRFTNAAPATKSAHSSRFTKCCACMPRTLHIEVHKGLRLPRILHFKKQVKTLITIWRDVSAMIPAWREVIPQPSFRRASLARFGSTLIEKFRASAISRTCVEVHKVLCLPRHLHIEVHKVLCLPRDLRIEVHKVLCLPQNLHIEVHKVLRLPRNLHFKKQVKTLSPWRDDSTMIRAWRETIPQPSSCRASPAFRASAISRTRILYETSFQSACWRADQSYSGLELELTKARAKAE